MDALTREQLQRLYESRLFNAAGDAAHPEPEELLALAEGQGSEHARLRTADHVMQCATCREGLALLRSLRSGAQDEGMLGTGVAARDSGRASWPWSSGRVLAAASLLLALGLGTLWVSRNTATSAEDTLRGAADFPAAIAPVGAVGATDARRLTWHPAAGATGYSVEFLSADGALLHFGTTTDTTLTLPTSVVLEAGREYQWLVTADQAGSRRRVAPAARVRVR
jgi:hypothetical protein